MGPVGLEPFRPEIFLVHRSHSLIALRHGFDERKAADVTPAIVKIANPME